MATGSPTPGPARLRRGDHRPPGAGSSWSPPSARRPRRHPRPAGPFGRPLAALAAATALTAGALLPSAGPAGAGLAAEQTQASQVQQQIVQQGILVQQLVSQADAAQAKLASIDSQVAATSLRLAADQQATRAAAAHLRRVALDAYMAGNLGDAALSLFETQGGEHAAANQEYTSLAAGSLRDAIDTEQADAHRTQVTAQALHAEQAQVAATVAQLAGERQRAQAALDHDTTMLSQIHSTIAQLQAQAALKQLAAQRAAQEQALAAEQQKLAQEQAAAAAVELASVPPAPTITPSPGVYADPLRGISALSPERIDQGVDYSGYGPVYAVGDGVVLNTVNAGWPGGTFITYRLTDGRAAGLVVFAAEDIEPSVSVGQRVTAATVIGTLYEGPDGMETGWADGSGQGFTMAHDYGQFSGANSTAFGANFSQLLASTGAPPGVLQNSPPTGSLPSNWPTW